VLAATAGGLLGMARKEVSHRTLCGLVSFAAGALLSVTALHIAPESIELAGNAWAALAALGAGILLFYLIGKYVSYVCPACAASAVDRQTGYLRLGILLMIALAIHSTMDGVAIAVGAESREPFLGVLILFAVSYHKIPEGLALTSVARLAGFSRGRALVITILIELTTGLGALLGFAVGGISSFWMGMVLAHAGGSFLYVVGFALFTELQEHEKAPVVVYTALGFAAMAVTGLTLEHTGLAAHGH